MTTSHRSGWAGTCFLGAILAAVVAPSHALDKGMNPSRAQNVSIQVVNPDVQTNIRVSLDGKVIFEAVPVPSTVNHIPTVPEVAGPFSLAPGSRHDLIAEVPGGGARAQLKWAPSQDAGAWIVIHYYPGRADSNIPPFFAFAIQGSPHKLR